MEVTYTLTREDLIHYYRYALTRQGGAKLPLLTFCGALFLLVGTAGTVMAFRQSTGNVAIYVAFIWWGTYIIWTYSNFRLGRVVDKQAATNPSLYASYTLTIDAEWFAVHSVYEDIRVRWQAVHYVSSDDAYIFVAVGGIAYIIARTNFSTHEDAERFYALANTHWQTAKQRPLPEEGVWPPAPRL